MINGDQSIMDVNLEQMERAKPMKTAEYVCLLCGYTGILSDGSENEPCPDCHGKMLMRRPLQ